MDVKRRWFKINYEYGIFFLFQMKLIKNLAFAYIFQLEENSGLKFELQNIGDNIYYLFVFGKINKTIKTYFCMKN